MERKQIYLDPGSDSRLKRLARQRGVSEASLIRKAIDAYLAKAEEKPSGDERKDPLLQLIGIYGGDLPPDAAEEHDHCLYDEEDR